MVTVNRTPECDFFPAYVPITWQLNEFLVYSEGRDPYSAIDVEVYVNNELVETLAYQPKESNEVSLNSSNNIFEVNISSTIQRQFDNEDAAPDPSIQGYNATQSGRILNFFIRVYSWLPNNERKLFREEAFYESDTYKAVNAIVDRCADHCLPEYFTQLERKFLTNKPRKRTLCFDEYEYLTLFKPSGSIVYRITTYDFNRSVIETGILVPTTTSGNTDSQPNTTETLHTIGVSPNQINSQTAWQDGNNATIDSDVWYYTVQLVVPNSPTTLSELFTFYVKKGCCVEYTLLFLNQFGEFDTVAVEKNDFEQYQTNSFTYQKTAPARSATNYKSLRSTVKQYSELQDTFELLIQGITTKTANWLKELANSPNVFLIEEGEKVAITILDSQQVPQDVYATTIDLSLQAQYTRKTVSQRN